MRILLEVADRYAKELDVQFGTLGSFAKNPGEIGRAHESYLAAVIRRLLPGMFRVGSGFVATSGRVSSQQDVLIFNSLNVPLLYSVGDCVVVDENSLAGSIEVKTTLNVREFKKALSSLKSVKPKWTLAPFTGVFGWDGIGVGALANQLWKSVRDAGGPIGCFLPDVIYVRAHCLLLRFNRGHVSSAPYKHFKIGSPLTDGQALLLLICRLWEVGLSDQGCVMPEWLKEGYDSLLMHGEAVNWPPDLHQPLRIESEGSNP